MVIRKYEKLLHLTEKIGSGATPTGGKDSYHQSGIALIRSQNVYNDGFHTSGLAFIDENQASKLDNVIVKADDILLNITGDSIARSCQPPKNILPARVNQHVAIIRPRKSELHPRYLRFVLISPEIQSELFSISACGATRDALTKEMIQNIVIPLPPLPTQRAIAHILGTLDDKLELLRQMNETLEAMARALFKSWFIDFDPVRKKAEGLPTGLPPEIDVLFPDSFEDSELGEIPKGWEIGSIKQYCNAINEQQSPDQFSGTENYVGLEHIPRKSIALLSFGNSEDLESNKAQFIEDDILFGKLRPYFHKVVFAPENGICSTDILVIRPNERDNFSFCLMHLSSEAMVDYATSYSNGTKMPRASWNDIQNYKVAAPPQKLIQYFNNISIYQLKMIKRNIKENKELVKIRDALLPKLISGNLEVKDIDKILEPAI